MKGIAALPCCAALAIALAACAPSSPVAVKTSPPLSTPLAGLQAKTPASALAAVPSSPAYWLTCNTILPGDGSDIRARAEIQSLLNAMLTKNAASWLSYMTADLNQGKEAFTGWGGPGNVLGNEAKQFVSDATAYLTGDSSLGPKIATDVRILARTCGVKFQQPVSGG